MKKGQEGTGKYSKQLSPMDFHCREGVETRVNHMLGRVYKAARIIRPPGDIQSIYISEERVSRARNTIRHIPGRLACSQLALMNYRPWSTPVLISPAVKLAQGACL